jgi:hypothetical protein
MSNAPNHDRTAVTRNGLALLASMAGTFVLLRIWLSFSPNTDFNVAGYNIHHLFTGLVLVSLGAVPLAVLEGRNPVRSWARVVMGIGLGMALDEWVYLIATDGTNASYLLPVSFWGGVVVLGLVCAYAVGVMVWARR